jgi:Predicted metalloprotease
MRRLWIMLAVMAIALAPHGTAHAYPVTDKRLTHNALYRAGALDQTACTEKRVRPGDFRLAKAYLYGILDCLNAAWSAHLKEAGLPFRKPALKVVRQAPRRWCGVKWGDLHSYYCDERRTILVRLDKNLLADPTDLYLFAVLSDRYGQHVQNLTGIYRAFIDHDVRNKREEQELSRRYELQSLCFGTAFLRSTWNSLDRTTRDWRLLLSYMKDWKHPTVGTSRTIAYWSNRGFAKGDPAACNTWAAPSGRVA